jgi:tetratricopeptide (TPR) repeat protein
MKQAMILGVLLVLVGTASCSARWKPLVPLAVTATDATPQVVSLTEQGTQAYKAKQFEEAKNYFEQAVSAVPQSGQAHYNYALALNALGKHEIARQHFLEAANLAPGDKVIWDSPALAPYGDPDTRTRAREYPSATQRSSFGSSAMGGMPRY